MAAFLAKGAGKGLLLRGVSGNLEDDASTANKSVAAGAVTYENSDTGALPLLTSTIQHREIARLEETDITLSLQLRTCVLAAIKAGAANRSQVTGCLESFLAK